jgi:mono/diheme cytochrome c family protein
MASVWGATVLVMTVWTVSAVAAFAQAPDQANPFASAPDVIAEGKELYISAGCYACHGTQATGRGRLGPDLTALKKTDAEIHELLTKTFKGKVTGEEIWKIMVYLRSLAER